MVEMRGFHYVKLCFFMLPIAHDSGLLNNVLNEKKKKQNWCVIRMLCFM